MPTLAPKISNGHIPMRRFPKGFSFIEIMLVLIVFGVMATIATPQFFSAFESAEQAEFRNLVRVFKLLRNEAILSHSRYFIVFDLNEQKYHIEITKKEGGQAIVEEPKILRPHEFPEGFHLEDVSFTSDFAEIKRSRESLLQLERKTVPIMIDSSGFVPAFNLLFSKGDEQFWVIRSKNIMGKLVLEEVEGATF